MKILVLFLYSLSIAFYSEASLLITKSDDGPPGVCYIKSNNITIPNNESVIKECAEYRCNYPYYTTMTCGVAIIEGPDGEPCRAALDLSKPYPHCCMSDKCE